MSDQELDDLFKNASTKYEAPFDEKEWEKMAALLDDSSSPKPAFWNWKKWSGLGLLLVVGSTLIVTQWDRISGEYTKSNESTTSALIRSDDSLSNTSKQSREIVTEGDEAGKSELNKDDKEKVQLNSSNSDLPQSGSDSKIEIKKADLKNPSAKRDVVAENKDSKKTSISSEIIDGESTLNMAKNTVKSEEETERNKPGNIHSKTTTGKKESDSKNEEQNFHGLAKGKQSKKSAVLTLVASEPVIADEALVKKEEVNKSEKVENTLGSGFSERQDAQINQSQKESLSVSEDRILETVKTEGKKSREVINGTRENYQAKNDNLTGSSNPSDNETKMNEAYTISDSAKSKPVAVEKKDSVVVKDVARKEENQKTDSLTKLQRFSVKLALSPDFSSVGYYKPGKTGFNYGLLGEYNITSHWSISFGAIWSKKIYFSNTTEDSAYGTNSTNIKGSCRVLDLPLNINYYFTPQNRFTFYSALGLSSYFMFDEDYTYDYIYGTKSYSYTKKIDRGNTEWFRMMNLSVGIQQQLSQHLKLQLEPFIKAPLSGIGGGDLKLVSSGVFLNLKYTFK